MSAVKTKGESNSETDTVAAPTPADDASDLEAAPVDMPPAPSSEVAAPDAVRLDAAALAQDTPALIPPPQADERATAFEYWRWRVGLLIVSGIMATNFPLMKLVETAHYSGAEMSAVRFAIAIVPFLPSLVTEVGRVARDEGNSRACAVGGVEVGLWCVLGYVTQAIGMDMTSAPKGAFIGALCMVVCPIANAFAGAKIPLQTWVAVALAVVGTGVLEGLGGLLLSGEGTTVQAGDPWILGAALGFGLMLARMEHHVKIAGSDPASVFRLTVWQMAPLFVCMTGWAAWELEAWPSLLSARALDPMAGATVALGALPAVVYMGLVSTAAVLWAQTTAMGEVPSSEAGVIFATEPIFATLYASLLLGDNLTAEEAVGGAFIILACLTLQLPAGGDGAEPESPEK